GALQHARRDRRACCRIGQRARGIRMMSDLQELYQEVILDHNRRPRNFRALDDARKAEGYNPLCGDRLTVYLRVDDGVIKEATFLGPCCAISKPSESRMIGSVKRKAVAEAKRLFEHFRRTVTASPDVPVEYLGKLSVLAGVRKFPVRVKCATL